MKILVTGGAGFIGSHIVEYFQEKADIVVFDNLRTGKKSNIESFEHTFIEGDICDRSAVKKAMVGVDYVFHLAAMVSVMESVDNPEECFKINADGTKLVLEEAAKAEVKKLCFSSTCAVYGDAPGLPKTEESTVAPLSPYSEAKLKAEKYCIEFAESGKLQTTCFRYFNVFGPRQMPDSQYAAAIPIFISKAVKNEKITIFGDGEQSRDFVYVKDIVGANVFMSMNSTSGIYNVAYAKPITVNELVKIIKTNTGSICEVEYAPERDGEVKHSYACVNKLAGTGFTPQYDFERGMAATINFFKELEK